MDSVKRVIPTPYIIAEIGFNHEGDMELAKEMIEKAAQAGANAVKFQTFRALDLALPSSAHFNAIQRGELNLHQHRELASIARANRIDFLSTPYSSWAVDLLEKIGVKAYKIASMDLTNLELLRYVAKTKKPLIISTGMATLSEILSTVKALRSYKSGSITLLHCLSKYPANPIDVNLAFMNKIRKVCKCPVGYSDHTKGTMTCLIAAILGAQVIEKHFTLDSSKPGADHYHSADPIRLKRLIEDIHSALSIIGGRDQFVKRLDRCHSRQLRRGIYARLNIPKGTRISKRHLTCCRPEADFSARDLDKILGRIARYDIGINRPITKDAIKQISKRDIQGKISS